MKFGKGNLAVVDVASTDPFDRGINGVRFEPDGTTVACNKKVLLAMSPVDDARILYPDVGEVCSPGESGFVLELDHVKDVIKNIPKVKKLSLLHCQMTRSHDIRKVELTTVAENGMEKRCAHPPKHDPFVDWRKVVRHALQDAEGKEYIQARACVNRKDLIALLVAMEKACPDKGGDNPVFIEFGRGLVLRSVHHDSGQRAIGVVNPYNVGDGGWLERSAWEKTIFGVKEVGEKIIKGARRLVKKVRRKA